MNYLVHHHEMELMDETEKRWAKELGKRLAAARAAKGWSLERLASQVGMTRASVGHWETGARSLKADQLIVLCHLLGVSADELLFGREHWPFDLIDFKAIQALERSELDRLEGALLYVAGQLGLDIGKRSPTPEGAPQFTAQSSYVLPPKEGRVLKSIKKIA